MSDLVDKMKVVLADTFAFYLKAHYFHWNVEGPDFPEYHKFFGDIYEEVFDAVDVIAEKIRTLDSYAPGSFKRFEQLSTIETIETVPDAKGMIAILAEDNDSVIDTIVAAMAAVNKPKHKGIENFLQERLDAHQKHAWMLRATRKNNGE